MRARGSRRAGTLNVEKWRNTMRRTAIVPAALLLLTSGPALAQEPIDYVSKVDYFSINMPSAPKIEETTYPDEYRLAPLPARVYTADQGRNHYKVTVVDYRGVPRMHAPRNAQCIHEAGAD